MRPSTKQNDDKGCLLCGSLRHYSVFNESGVDILRCDDCGHVFSSFSARPHYDGFWGDEVPQDNHYYWSQARFKMHQDFFREFLVGRSGKLLDMGSGLGFFLKAMAPYTSWESYGCEISPAAVRYARNTLGLPNIICCRLEKAYFAPASFDIITMWDVLEHVLHPDPLLNNCHSLLKEGGICFIRTPNLHVQLSRARLMKMLKIKKNGEYLQPRDHLHHYSMASIRELLERNGFMHVEFIHLHPIQSAADKESPIWPEIKNACFQAASILSFVSRGKINFDNLFVIAHKKSMSLT